MFSLEVRSDNKFLGYYRLFSENDEAIFFVPSEGLPERYRGGVTSSTATLTELSNPDLSSLLDKGYLVVGLRQRDHDKHYQYVVAVPKPPYVVVLLSPPQNVQKLLGQQFRRASEKKDHNEEFRVGAYSYKLLRSVPPRFVFGQRGGRCIDGKPAGQTVTLAASASGVEKFRTSRGTGLKSLVVEVLAEPSEMEEEFHRFCTPGSGPFLEAVRSVTGGRIKIMKTVAAPKPPKTQNWKNLLEEVLLASSFADHETKVFSANLLADLVIKHKEDSGFGAALAEFFRLTNWRLDNLSPLATGADAARLIKSFVVDIDHVR
jgi:hypothetical protein